MLVDRVMARYAAQFATFTKLRDGSWGLRVPGKASAGQVVQTLTKGGKADRKTVGKVLWSGTDPGGSMISLCTIAVEEETPWEAPPRGQRILVKDLPKGRRNRYDEDVMNDDESVGWGNPGGNYGRRAAESTPSTEGYDLAYELKKEYSTVKYDPKTGKGSVKIGNIGLVQFRDSTNERGVIIELPAKTFKTSVDNALETLEKINDILRNTGL